MKGLLKFVFNRQAEIKPLDEDWIIPGGANGKQMLRPPIDVGFWGSEGVESESLKRKNENKFRRALLILSQSQTGRYLLEAANHHGYMIEIDDDLCREDQVYGYCDPTDKTITIGCEDVSVEEMVIVLAHELSHAVQFSNAIPPTGDEYTPYDDMIISLAQEADAVAHELQVAYELKEGCTDGPVNQFKTNKCVELIKEYGRMGEMATALVEKAIKDNPKNLDNGLIMALGFESFYQNTPLRRIYEDSLIYYFESKKEGLQQKTKLSRWGKVKNAYESYRVDGELKEAWKQAVSNRVYKKEIDNEKLLNAVRHMNKSYLAKHLPNLDFKDIMHGSVSTDTKRRIVSFFKGLNGYQKQKKQADKLKVYSEMPRKHDIKVANKNYRLHR